MQKLNGTAMTELVEGGKLRMSEGGCFLCYN